MKIIKYKKIRNKYRVYLDNNETIDLYENVIINNNLLIKKEITDIDKLKKDNRVEEILDISLRYINTKLRTKSELKKYLKRKLYSDNEIDVVIDKLERLNYLNDETYIRGYINDKFYLTKDGPLKIKNDLINLRLNENIIEDYLDKIDHNEIMNKLEKLIDKKLSIKSNYSGNVLKMKTLSYFYTLGYDKEDILYILDRKTFTNIDKGISEYKKLINKYSKKYSGYELERVVEQKLYQKGYDLDEIKKGIV